MRHRLGLCLISCLLLLAACSLLVACKRGGEPVARLTVAKRQLELQHGIAAALELRWEPSKALPQGVAPVVFVHLLDAQGNVVRTFDHSLAGSWRPGEPIEDRVRLYHSAIGPALPPGDYRLVVGLYDGRADRFALTVEGEEIHRQEYAVAQVKVPELSTAAPAFTFSPEWLPAEPGADRQTVARRWLAGDGTLEVRGLVAPARVWMLLRIPRPEPPLRLLLEPMATQPTARVSSDCGVGFSADVAGEGFHEVAVPARAQGPCRVTFDTNYSVVEMGTGRKLSLGLEQLAWEPGDGSGGAPGAP
jgi:hypothetical protein